MEVPVIELRPETQDILRRVEELTGVPVDVAADSTQSTLASMTPARGGAPAHLIRANPSLGEPDYLIIYQCGFLLRQYAIPADERWDFAGTAQGRDEVGRLVRRSGQLAQLPDTAKQQLTQQLFDGLLTQLRSYPIGMRIDSWIHETFPNLANLQRDAIAHQQQENQSVLRPEIRSFAPKPVYDANVTMNAAYAIFCDRVFGKMGYSIPFRSAGFEKPGRALVEILQSTPDDPTSDRSLVDSWAENLGLSGWYQWIPLQS